MHWFVVLHNTPYYNVLQARVVQHTVQLHVYIYTLKFKNLYKINIFQTVHKIQMLLHGYNYITRWSLVSLLTQRGHKYMYITDILYTLFNTNLLFFIFFPAFNLNCSFDTIVFLSVA